MLPSNTDAWHWGYYTDNFLDPAADPEKWGAALLQVSPGPPSSNDFSGELGMTLWLARGLLLSGVCAPHCGAHGPACALCVQALSRRRCPAVCRSCFAA